MGDATPYLHGFLVSLALLIVEHLTIYPWLRPKGDWGVLGRFIAGVLATLGGCALIAWETGEPIAALAPIAANASGVIIILAYAGHWLWQQAKDAAYTRGRLHGLADQGDIEEDGR